MEGIFELIMVLVKHNLPKINSKEEYRDFYKQVRINGELTHEEMDGFFFSSDYLYSVAQTSPEITSEDYDNGYILWVKNNSTIND